MSKNFKKKSRTERKFCNNQWNILNSSNRTSKICKLLKFQDPLLNFWVINSLKCPKITKEYNKLIQLNSQISSSCQVKLGWFRVRILSTCLTNLQTRSLWTLTRTQFRIFVKMILLKCKLKPQNRVNRCCQDPKIWSDHF